MQNHDKKCCSLEMAQQIILRTLKKLPQETVVLHKARQRFAACDVAAVTPRPAFDESTRDGYVIPQLAQPPRCIGSDAKLHRYTIVDEIPAGKPSRKTLATGTACRIMTGGCVPKMAARVVPFEGCVEENDSVVIADPALQVSETFIKKSGSEIAQGELLVSAGEVLQADHLALLASCGMHSVTVAARPVVGYVCTGSELAAPAEELGIGQKVSSNSFLISGLLASVGARPIYMGLIQDSEQELFDLFTQVCTEQPDVLITTGGMGPGKYDLVEKIFTAAGGRVLFNALAMRPGQSVLFGLLGQTLVFGLPGPPHAVRTLLHELVGPVLWAMQGRKSPWPKKITAHVLHQIKIKPHTLLRLKEAVLVLQDGRCSVRFADRLEVPNCLIAIEPGKSAYKEGELVPVHLSPELSCSYFWQCGQK